MSSNKDKDFYKPLIKGLNKDKIPNYTRLARILMDHFFRFYTNYGEAKAYVYKSQLKDDTGSLSHLAQVLCDKRFLRKGENGKLHIGPKLLTRLKRAHKELSGTQISTYKIGDTMTKDERDYLRTEIEKIKQDSAEQRKHLTKMTRVLNAVVKTMINNGDFEEDGVFPPADAQKIEKTRELVEGGKTKVLMDDILEVN